MKLSPKSLAHNDVRAFSLVEVTLALGITGFCLLALFGLLPIGISSNQSSVTQSAAASIATAIVADLKATPVASGTNANIKPISTQYKIQIPSPLPASTNPTKHTVFFSTNLKQSGTTDQAANPAQDPFYRAMLFIGKDPATKGTATVVRILITWPALADRQPNTTPANYTGSFETMVAFDRN